MKCKYCSKEFSKLKAIKQHECRCKDNIDRLPPIAGFNKKGRTAWNKGLDLSDTRMKKRIENF